MTYTYEDAYNTSLAYFDGDDFAAKNFVDKYALRDKDGELLESSPLDMHKREAREIARVEARKFEDALKEEEIIDLLHHFKYIVPQGSCQAGLGNPYQYVSLSNCFAVESPYDSMGGIEHTDEELVQISKRRGGVGVDVSTLRPNRCPTTNSSKSSTGPITFVKKYSHSIRGIGQGGRRGASLLGMSVHHPDILEFIHCKQDKEEVTGANLSVRLSDEFLNAVANDTTYTQRWPVDSKTPEISKQASAREVWDEIIKCAWGFAEPGLLFWDNILRESIPDCYAAQGFATVTTNPCQPAWAYLLTPNGLRSVGYLSVGDVVWSQDGWVTIQSKESKGIQEVWRYQTKHGVFYGAPKHRVVQNNEKIEAELATKIDTLGGSPCDKSVPYNRSMVDDGSTYNMSMGYIPARYMEGVPQNVVAFLRGLFSKYGIISNSGLSIQQKDGILIEQVQLLLSSLGIVSCAKDKVCHINTRTHLWKYLRLIGFTDEAQKHELANVIPFISLVDPRITSSIIAKEMYSEEEVWEIAVDGPSHTYWHGGLNVSNCGEIPLCPDDSCRLLLNVVYNYVDNPFTKHAKFNTELFYKNCKLSQRLMDDIIDVEIECIGNIIKKIRKDPEPQNIKSNELELWKRIKEKCEKGRRTGIGMTGLADAIAALGMKYGSDESIEFVDNVYRLMKFACYESSIEMAEKAGPFPIWNQEQEKDNPFLLRLKSEEVEVGGVVIHGEDLYKRMKKSGRRNIALLTSSPAGTMSILTQTSSGIEPVFSLVYKRRKKIIHGDTNFRTDFVDKTGDCWMEFEVLHPPVKKWMEVTGETDITKSPWYGCCANDIDWKQRVKLQSVAQKSIDHSISATVNLPSTATIEDVKEIYESAWKMGCKGITVYRAGCRDGVMMEVDKPPTEGIVNTVDTPRPKSLPCDVHHINVKGKGYFVLVGMYNGAPFEVFAGTNGIFPKEIQHGIIIKKKKNFYKFETSPGVSKDDEFECSPITMSMSEVERAISRLISGLLRCGAKMVFIVDQLEKVGESEEMHSFSRALSRVLKKYIADGTAEPDAQCPECKANSMVRQGGCPTCTSCGYSKCA